MFAHVQSHKRALFSKIAANPMAVKILNIKLHTLLVVCVSLMTLGLTANLVNGQYNRDYIPDSTANQAIIQSIVHNEGGHGVFAVDSFITHFPLYLFTDALIHDNSRAKLFVQAYVLAILLLACVFLTLVYYLRALGLYNRLSLLIGTLIAAFIFSTPIYAEYLLQINQRQLEAGMMLLLLIAAHMALSSTTLRVTKKFSLLAGAYVLALGLLWYDDPYFMFVMGGGIALATLILWIYKKISSQKIALIISILLASAIAARVYELIFSRLGIHLVPNSNTMLLYGNHIFSSIEHTVVNILINFNGDVFGLDVLAAGKRQVVALTGGAVLAFFAISSIVYSARHYAKNTFMLRTLLSTSALALILLYYLSQTGHSIVPRYFITLPILLLPVMTEFMIRILQSERNRIGYVVLVFVALGLLAVTATNLLGVARAVTHPDTTARNSSQYEVLEQIERTGITKGYANYWQAPLVSYFSNGNVDALHSICIDGQNRKVMWMVDADRFNVPAKRTFLVIDPWTRDYEVCSLQENERQFGEPTKVVKFGGNKSLLIYDYDITTKMPDYYLNPTLH